MKVKHKELITSIKDSRTFIISGATDTITPHYFNGEVVSLKTKDYNIVLGQKFAVGRRNYKINIITKKMVNSAITYELSSDKLTKSSLFILPMLNGNRRLYMFDSLFINCFIGTKEYKNHIVLLYRFSGESTFLKFEEALSQFAGFVKTYDPSPEYVVFVFKIPSTQEKNYNYIINGKYSKIDILYKNKILEFHNFTPEGDLAQILFRSKNRKKRLEEQLGIELPNSAELHSVMDLEAETFNPDIYI
tara:strand:+ start:802 stop:1542 length:741 start_codon:yes stop_codon:yes gene_type:complete